MDKTFRIFFTGLILTLYFSNLMAQQDSLKILHDSVPVLFQTKKLKKTSHFTTDINAPAKAAFYSAVLPGLGQIYNKQYWKVPLVYALLTGGIYLYQQNQLQYLRYRKAYQNRLTGLPDEFPQYSTDILVTAQSYYRRNRDLSFMGTLLIYALNIIDANVSAHLRLWNIDNKLSWKWAIPVVNRQKSLGIKIIYRF